MLAARLPVKTSENKIPARKQIVENKDSGQIKIIKSSAGSNIHKLLEKTKVCIRYQKSVKSVNAHIPKTSMHTKKHKEDCNNPQDKYENICFL